jgi:transcriptional regulator GlxA family with amidase domain
MDSSMSKQRPVKINLLATSYTSASTLYGMYDLLATAGIVWERSISGEPVSPQFEVAIVAIQRKPFRCARNVLVSPHSSIDEAGRSDIVCVPSQAVLNTGPLPDFESSEIEWIKSAHDQGSLITSACTGLLVLAETGLLNGWEATTHWAYADLFRSKYPEIRLRIEQNLSRSGPNNEIVTSGGTTAWQELALFIIASYCGAEHAAHIAKFWLIQSRTENQSAFAALPRVTQTDDAVVNECQNWISINYAFTNPVNEMILQSGLPPTSFARRFKQATGHRPIDYVHILRVDRAKDLLEISSSSVENIGRDVGYEDPASFRRIFKRKVGLTPSSYRQKFAHSRFEKYNAL